MHPNSLKLGKWDRKNKRGRKRKKLKEKRKVASGRVLVILQLGMRSLEAIETLSDSMALGKPASVTPSTIRLS